MSNIERDRQTDACILRILKIIRYHGVQVVKMGDLARSVYREQNYVARRCRALHRAGKVIVGVDPNDRRRYTVTATDYGLRPATESDNTLSG